MDNTKNIYDLIIIGAGAAGLSAAIYAGRAKLKTLVVEKSDIGGQIKITAEVVNYPGVFSTSGAALVAEMKRQAVHFGVDFTTGDVAAVDFGGDIKAITLDNGETFSSVGVIIATGAKPRQLGFEGEKEFAGRGVAYCATCDGEFFTGKDVFVIGAGFAAAEEAIFLTRFAKKVTVIAREPEFTCSKTIADKVLTHPKIEVKFNSEIMYVRGTNLVKEAMFIDNETKETWVHEVDTGTFGCFVFVGYQPESNVFKGHIDMDNWGYIPTNDDMQTNVAGIYAAGDIRPKRLRQLVTATADGAIASTAIEKYIDDTKHKLGIEIEREEKPLEDNQHGSKASLLDGDTATQIKHVMGRLSGEASIVAVLEPNCEVSSEIRAFLEEFANITSRVPVNIFQKGENPDVEAKITTDLYPVIALMGAGGVYSGVNFHGIPGGHELESFILAIYNLAGPGQAIPDALKERIKNINKPYSLKIGISLSCTMCPELVQACQRVAILNNGITAEMVDLQHYPELRDEHDIMSVPALIINNKDVLFGKKGIEELVGHLE
ncbi:MAG: FAD-dependent oxidoreductase [Defluviitaleaceae bacterium]|nr:FAD-dependent oxidoreductase [Defluviitaleaceae bacterium]